MPTNLAHPCLRVPPPETPIWRYMRFSKFVSMLLSKAVFFTRCDKFDDPWEGSWTQKNSDRGAIIQAKLSAGMPIEKAEAEADRWIKTLAGISQNIRQDHAISCWHINRSESDAAWRVYSHMDEGLAIRSTVGNLAAALSAQQEREVFISAVTYLDYRTQPLPVGNTFFPVTHKRDAFRHENELRAIICSAYSIQGVVEAHPFRSEHGESLPVDLNNLILEIIVSPLAPIWFVNDVNEVIRRLGYSFPCRRSTHLDPP